VLIQYAQIPKSERNYSVIPFEAARSLAFYLMPFSIILLNYDFFNRCFFIDRKKTWWYGPFLVIEGLITIPLGFFLIFISITQAIFKN
jgi:hypothetical protein